MSVISRDTCRLCGGSRMQPLVDLGMLPLADHFLTSPDAPDPAFPVRVATCLDCFLVQLMDDVDDSVLFGDDYAFFTGGSPSSLPYFERYAQEVLTHFPDQCTGLVVEIASNDGTLLRHFQQVGSHVLGVEPAASVAEAARRSGVRTAQVFFSQECARRLREEEGAATVIIANNVIAHVRDPHDFLAGAAHLLAPDGIFVLEFQYLPYLLFNNQFDHLYHEHRSFFSLWPLVHALGDVGLVPVEVQDQPAQGGSVRVFVKHRAEVTRRHVSVDAFLGSEGVLRLNEADTYLGFEARCNYVREQLRLILWTMKGQDKRLAGYGASAKSSVLLNYCGIGPDLLEFIIDRTPWKFGRYSPGVHIPVIDEAEAPERDAYLLLVWNYLHGVLRRSRPFLDCGGQFVVPIPTPYVVGGER